MTPGVLGAKAAISPVLLCNQIPQIPKARTKIVSSLQSKPSRYPNVAGRPLSPDRGRAAVAQPGGAAAAHNRAGSLDQGP